MISEPMEEIEMKDIVSLRIINEKIPAIELEFKNDDGVKRSVFFSMMSDDSVQDTLIQLKRLKKEGQL